jgi:hypothetical protein
MPGYSLFDGSISLEALGLRLSPSALLVGECHAVVMQSLDQLENEPLPDPEQSPGPDPGTNAPVAQPPLPPSGPIGPGTS